MKKVYVALSGGVDSAVSAAMLLKEGFVVHGVHMKMWTLPLQGNECGWQNDLKAAQEVAEYLKIPFEVWDFTKDYQKDVVEYLFKEYKSGLTPNPDVMCNRNIKFGLFYDKAIQEGADFVATGHYARIIKGRLHRGIDKNKDQSYFLWAIPREKLGKIIFPVGNKIKRDVRALAKAFGLPNADRKDSQGICFIGKLDLSEFLKLRIPSRNGLVVDQNGKKIGEHQGVWFYTIGQRHGFRSAVGKPQYVVKKDVKSNKLMVAENDDRALYSYETVVGNLNWLGVRRERSNIRCQTRYRQKPIKIQKITEDSMGKLRIKFDEAAWALAPGQSMVLYHNDALIAGGVIEKSK